MNCLFRYHASVPTTCSDRPLSPAKNTTSQLRALQTGSNKIDVVKMNFAGVESMRWKELFAGFDTLQYQIKCYVTTK